MNMQWYGLVTYCFEDSPLLIAQNHLSTLGVAFSSSSLAYSCFLWHLLCNRFIQYNFLFTQIVPSITLFITQVASHLSNFPLQNSWDIYTTTHEICYCQQAILLCHWKSLEASSISVPFFNQIAIKFLPTKEVLQTVHSKPWKEASLSRVWTNTGRWWALSRGSWREWSCGTYSNWESSVDSCPK